jgi:hypothetical protein
LIGVFHGDKTGSNPVGDANKTKDLSCFLSLPVRGAAQSVLAVRCADVTLDAATRIQACNAIIA